MQISRLLVLTALIAACSTNSTTSPPPPTGTGTVSGVVSNNSGTGLAGVTVTVTPTGGSALPAVTTSANGSYTVSNVPAGSGVAAVSNVPSSCTAPTPSSYSGLTNGGTVTDNITVACTAAPGSLVIVITGANGVAPTATVTGPGGFSKTVSATTTLTGLASGSYTVTTPSGVTTITSPIVNTNYTSTVLGSPANVTTASVDTVSVTYSADGTGALWFGSYGATAAQLGQTGTIAPADSCYNSTNFPFAFDAKGDLWVLGSVTSGGNMVDAIMEFTPAQLGTSCLTAPAVAITGVPSTSPGVSIAFDAHGTLWVASQLSGNSQGFTGGPSIYGFTAAQLATSGSPTPAIVLTPTGPAAPGVMTTPQWIAFDAAGNLWDADNQQVLEYTAAQLAGSGSPTPQTLATSGTATDQVSFIGFDAHGNLWALATNNGSGSILSEFAKSALAGLSGNSSPSPLWGTSQPQTGFGQAPSEWSSFAFDNSGNLWMLDNGVATQGAAMLRFPVANIGPGGSGAPDITVTSASLGGGPFVSYFGQYVAFNPTPTGLPLVGSRVARAPAPHLVQRRR